MSQLPAAAQAPLDLWGGAECTINRTGDRYLDQLGLAGHAARGDDLDRFAQTGLTALRYPLLWEAFACSEDPEALWAWHDQRLARLRALAIRPIIGLIHHGSGPAWTSLLEDRFASGLAQHAAQAAQRYPWVTDWTPVNEPLTTARFAALYGHWYPHCADERSFWLALLNQVDAVRASMAAIRAINPQARLVQTEDIGTTSATPERMAQADYDNMRRWASWDLLTGGFTPDHPFWDRLAGMGFADRLLAIAQAPCAPGVLGLNHYLTSDRFLDHRLERHPPGSHGSSYTGPLSDVEAVRVMAQAPGLAAALQACWDRYRLPIAITEVHNGCTREEQLRWFKEAWDTALNLRGGGVRILAVTAWSLLGAFDWDSLLTQDRGHYESGAFDLRSTPPRPTALVPLLRALAAGQPVDHPVLAGSGWWRRGVGVSLTERCTDRAPGARPILIAGATGTLGQAFAGACRLRNIDYALTGREAIDLRAPASMETMLDALCPWAVINCAGWVRVDEAEQHAQDCLEANFTGSVALAQACQARDIHYTCFSSDLVFDGKTGRAYVESDPTAPLCVYGQSKALADNALARNEYALARNEYALANGARTLVVRTASFFSPFDRHNFAVHLAKALRAGQPFRAASDCVTSPTYVPDLVRMTLDLIIDDECGLWHLANDGALSWAHFGQAIGDALGLRTDLIVACPADAMGWLAPRPRFAPLTSERGLIMPSLESAIGRFAEEMLANAPRA